MLKKYMVWIGAGFIAICLVASYLYFWINKFSIWENISNTNISEEEQCNTDDCFAERLKNCQKYSNTMKQVESPKLPYSSNETISIKWEKNWKCEVSLVLSYISEVNKRKVTYTAICLLDKDKPQGLNNLVTYWTSIREYMRGRAELDNVKKMIELSSKYTENCEYSVK